MRVIAALSVLVSAAVHLYLWLDFARDDDFLGPSFMLNAIAGAVIAVLLLVWPALGAGVPRARVRGEHARWPSCSPRRSACSASPPLDRVGGVGRRRGRGRRDRRGSAAARRRQPARLTRPVVGPPARSSVRTSTLAMSSAGDGGGGRDLHGGAAQRRPAPDLLGPAVGGGDEQQVVDLLGQVHLHGVLVVGAGQQLSGCPRRPARARGWPRTGTSPSGAISCVSTVSPPSGDPGDCGEDVLVPGPETGVSARSRTAGTASATTAAAAAASPATTSTRRRLRTSTAPVSEGSRVAGRGGSAGGSSRTRGVDEVEQPGHPGEGADRARALVAGVEVSLEVETLRGAEGTEHVRRVVVRVELVGVLMRRPPSPRARA